MPAPFTNWCRRVLLGLIALAVVAGAAARVEAVDEKYWELSPYTVRIELAVDTAVPGHRQLEEELTRNLDERILSTMHPLWSHEIVVSQGADRFRLLESLASSAEQEPVAGIFVDKQMFLSLRPSIEGVKIACREWDRSTRLWGPVLRRTLRQERMLTEACMRLLRDTFAPLATIQADAEDFSRVALTLKGSGLPSRTDEGNLVAPGQIFQPLLVRFDQAGELLEDNGVIEVPWTYLVAEPTEQGSWIGRVYSGTKRPFGLRRRGRSKHLAIAVRNPPATTRVRFFARHDKQRSLVGYEVFQRLHDDQPSEFLALTDASGSVEVPPTEVDVVTLFLRSDGQVLAKVPVSPGAKPVIEIPISDDTARLRAQAELTAFREQLIDVVARRSILIARVRQRSNQGDYNEARQLLGELDDLPGRANFNRILVSAERKKTNISADSRVQARITRMFSETRKLLGRFLDVRQISELRNEVNAAARGAKE